MKKIFLFISIIFFSFQNLYADNVYYLDFKLILNESTAGKKAQDFLKNKLESGIKSIKNKEKKIQDEEKEIIQQKKILSPENYKEKVSKLRAKVSSLQKERNSLLETISKQRAKARNELLRNLNPIIKEYMNEKKIRMVINKKSLF